MDTTMKSEELALVEFAKTAKKELKKLNACYLTAEGGGALIKDYVVGPNAMKAAQAGLLLKAGAATYKIAEK